jgi:hypothetical protein
MDFSAVAVEIKAFQTKLASINANWNGQGPDLMSPAEADAFRAAALRLNQELGTFLLKAGGCLAVKGL